MSRRNFRSPQIDGIGARIRAGREAMDWSQLDLGRAVGVSKSAVSQWEKGVVQNLKLGNLFATAKALDIDVQELVFGAATGVADRSSAAGYGEFPPQQLALLRTFGALPKDVQTHVRNLIVALARTQSRGSG